MPVRSLSSSVLKWPNSGEVIQTARRWACQVGQKRDDVLRIGCFGSYAKGTWGVGSDLDIVIVVKDTDQPFSIRASQWDTTPLPVPVDVIVYTQREWDSLPQGGRAAKMFRDETIWLYERA